MPRPTFATRPWAVPRPSTRPWAVPRPATRPWAVPRPATIALLVVLVVAAVVGVPAPATADPTRYAPSPDGWRPDNDAIVRYELPVDGPVLRAFDPPTTAHGAGHRGVDLDTPVGSTVRAAADGVVAFAGAVAGTTWVSIAHPDGVTTSYGPIAGPTVARGDPVTRGTPLGRLAAGGHGVDGHDVGLHWGARRHQTYEDPMALLGGGMPRPSLVGDGAWRATGHQLTPYQPWGGARWWGAGYHGSPDAVAPGFVIAPNANHLIAVSGLGSNTNSMPIDPTHLGYDLADVTALSYAGRSDVPGADDDPRRDQLPYSGSHTWEGVDAASLRLRDQLRAQQLREPGRAVDLIGHSLGGLTIVHYLTHHHDAYDRSLPPIGHVVTIAAPLHGSDVAALGADVRGHRLYGRALDRAHRYLVDSDGRFGSHVGPMPLDSPVLDDLRVGSPLITGLAAEVEVTLEAGAAGPLAMGTRILTIAGGTDVVVGPSRAALPHVTEADLQVFEDGPDVVHRVLPGDHERVLDTEAVREVVWRFLADEEVVDSPGRVSTGVSQQAGQLVRWTGRQLRINDLLLAPLVPGHDP